MQCEARRKLERKRVLASRELGQSVSVRRVAVHPDLDELLGSAAPVQDPSVWRACMDGGTSLVGQRGAVGTRQFKQLLERGRE